MTCKIDNWHTMLVFRRPAFVTRCFSSAAKIMEKNEIVPDVITVAPQEVAQVVYYFLTTYFFLEKSCLIISQFPPIGMIFDTSFLRKFLI